MLFDFLRKLTVRLTAIYGYLLFKRWGLYIRIGARVTGAQYITIDTKFGVGNHFWIAAIDRYQGVRYHPEILIGQNVSFGDFCHIAAINKIEIGNNVLIGSKVHITDHSHGNYTIGALADSPDSIPLFRKLFSSGEVKIGNNVWIGDGVVILPNVMVGDGVVIGANSVVSRNVPPNTIVAGAPARVIKYYEDGRWHRTKN